MQNAPPLRKELKEMFLQELTPPERLFFLKKAREAIILKRYPASEDLFHYCYFLTLRERLRGIERGGGYLRFLLVEGRRETEEAVRLYQERLEARRLPEPDGEGGGFLQYLE